MKHNKLSVWTRLLQVICGIGLFTVLFTPIWRIDLDAPQYPEGLRLNIHANGIRGNVDIINGLNHYIGMKTLHNEDFFEFTILPYCISFFGALFIIVALINRKKWFYSSFFLFVAFGIIVMIDFWRWEYNYGHNLDPHAAIVVPGMAYQPPLIGFKQLLNFGAFSVPDIGGWIFIGAGALMLLGVVIEWKSTLKFKKAALPFAAIIILLMGSCKIEPQKIAVGKDNCAFCKMTISDPRFGAEIQTSTGKAFKFDDIHCMNEFVKSMQSDWKKNTTFYFTDYCSTHELVEASKSVLLKSAELKCPMDGHLAAFSNLDSLNAVKAVYHGDSITWEQL